MYRHIDDIDNDDDDDDDGEKENQPVIGQARVIKHCPSYLLPQRRPARLRYRSPDLPMSLAGIFDRSRSPGPDAGAGVVAASAVDADADDDGDDDDDDDGNIGNSRLRADAGCLDAPFALVF